MPLTQQFEIRIPETKRAYEVAKGIILGNGWLKFTDRNGYVGLMRPGMFSATHCREVWGEEKYMARDEALTEAQKRWGDAGRIFDREVDGEGIDWGRCQRFWVGKYGADVFGNDYVDVFGNGDTWELAFEDV